MTTIPKISIVTPSFNQGKFLEKTILSVLEQGYPNLEYIIIDGGSTDESVAIIKKYADRLTYWVSEPDRGQSHAINKGFARATGEIFGWLNSDDWYHPGALQAVAEAFAAHPEAGAVVGAGEMVSEDSKWSQTFYAFPVTVDSLHHAVDHFFMQPSCFFTKTAWEECGPLDEELHLAMDLDLWLRIAKKHKYAVIENNLSVSLVHQTAKTTALAPQSLVDASLVIMKHGGESEGRNRLVAFVQELYEARHSMEVLKLEKIQLLSEKARLETEQAQYIRLLNETLHQLQDKEQRVSGLERSLSWRITAPIRAAADFCRRIMDGTLYRDVKDTVRDFLRLPPDLGLDFPPKIDTSAAPLIFMATHVKFYPPSAGNEIRVCSLLRHLKKKGYSIALLFTPTDGKLFSSEEIECIKADMVDYLYQVKNADRCPGRIIAADYKKLLHEHEPALERWAKMEETFLPYGAVVRAVEIIRRLKPQIVIAQYIWMSSVLKLAPPSTLKVIDLHDKFSDKLRKVCAYGVHDAFTPSEEEEIQFINRADIAIAIQSDEACRFSELKPRAKIITVGLDFPAVIPESSRAVEKKWVLIVASGNPLNIYSVQHFIDNVWAKIVVDLPGSTLRIVGGIGKALDCQESIGVEIAGYVPDLTSEYADATIVINPVIAGTGLKIKSLEALAHGKALVSTPAGVEGLPEKDGTLFLVGNDDVQLASHIKELLLNDSLCNRLQQHAIAYACDNLSPEKIYSSLDGAFETFLSERKQARVLCLFLCYGADDCREGFNELVSWYAEKIHSAKVTIWIVDNALEGMVDTVDPDGYRLLAGDNANWEFSGWQKILSGYGEEIAANFDMVHFVTDKFNKLYTGYLDHFREDHLNVVRNNPVCLGHIDCYDKPVKLAGNTSSCWIRTCFFFMSLDTLARIGSLISFADRRIFFDGNGQFTADAPLSGNYRELIYDWLSGKELQGVSWHSTISDREHFQAKALAILNEHGLSINLRNNGIALIDFCWMLYSGSRRLKDCLSGSVEKQLALRKKVLEGAVPLQDIHVV